MALSVCDSTTDLHQKELLQYGDPAFPIACYEDDLDITPVPWHWHNEWEFIYVQKGTAVILLENASISVSAGNGLFINSCTLHVIDSQQSRGAVLHAAVFHPRLIGGSVDSVFCNRLVLPLSGDAAPRYVVLDRGDLCHQQMLGDFHTAWKAVETDANDYENLTRYLLSRVWRCLCQRSIEANTVLSVRNRLDAQRIRSMLTYIDTNLAGQLRTHKIAESASVSESVCLRCFHRMLGMTPMQYVKQVRLDKASELLRVSTMTAKAIAYECGFHDVSYFTKAFRERMGCTPKEYQRKFE